MFAWEKVLIEKVVFKGRDKVMAEEIQPQRGFFFFLLTSGRKTGTVANGGRSKPRQWATLGDRLSPQPLLPSSHVPETRQGLS